MLRRARQSRPATPSAQPIRARPARHRKDASGETPRSVYVETREVLAGVTEPRRIVRHTWQVATERSDALLIDDCRDLAEGWQRSGGSSSVYRGDETFKADLPTLVG
jgi:hypothetical protein